MKIGEIGMNIKKVVAAALILSSMTAVSASAAEFNDIKGHWAEDVINELADKDCDTNACLQNHTGTGHEHADSHFYLDGDFFHRH